jgi:hypothetical protein
MNKDNFLDYPLFTIIETPFMQKNLLILSGDEGRDIFNTKVRELYPEWIDIDDADGLQYDNYIYVEDIENNLNILIHELSHYLDFCFKELSCKDESEFKAKLTEFIFTDIFSLFLCHKIKENK